MTFGVILADPPWRNSKSGSGKQGGGEQGGHSGDIYSDLSVSQLKELPVSHLVADNAYLFLWVDAQHHHVAPEVAEAWGFPKFSTKLTWLKQTSTGKDVGGIGRYTMIWAEDCWIFKRGNPSFVSTSERNPFYAKREVHSRKPDWLYEFIEKTHEKKNLKTRWPDTRLELFARTHFKGEKLWEPRPGWTQIGNEFENTLGEDITVSIAKLLLSFT